MTFRGKLLIWAACGLSALLGHPAAAQDHMIHATFNSSLVLGLLEIPFLALAIVYGLRTAKALQGGVFGRGMALMAGGMLVMAVGHLLMMLDMAFGMNLLGMIFGLTVGGLFWVIALVASWALVGTGFHSIYRASRS
jgi:hypothetical protein